MARRVSKQSVVTAGARKVWDWTLKRPLTVVGAYIFLISVLFLIFPGVDLGVSGLFFSEESGFWARWDPFLREVRYLGPHIVTIITIACLCMLLLKLLIPGRRPLMPLRTPIFLLTTLILGPGVLVNLILKNNWGRPRPHTVDVFGGDLPYQPVWLPSSYCDTNCSFVSGEASSGIWLIAVVLVAPIAWRFALLCFVLPLALILSINRIAFGGHFLSDTMISWGLTLFLALAVHKLLFVKTPQAFSDARLDEWFTRKGRILQIALYRLKGLLAQRASRISRALRSHS